MCVCVMKTKRFKKNEDIELQYKGSIEQLSKLKKNCEKNEKKRIVK